jgi:hypothetical protein
MSPHNSRASARLAIVLSREIYRRGRTPGCSTWDVGWPMRWGTACPATNSICEVLLEAMLTRIIIRHATVTSGRMPYREILTPAKLRALTTLFCEAGCQKVSLSARLREMTLEVCARKGDSHASARTI